MLNAERAEIAEKQHHAEIAEMQRSLYLTESHRGDLMWR
jgi:hypothetical protein